MQRFSTFPSGRYGAALLLLRGAVGGTLVVVGATYIAGGAAAGTWAAGALATVAGSALVIGLVTPVAVLVGLAAVGLALVWPPPGPSVLLDGKLAAVLVVVVAAAIALLGPGAFSLDARLFGRREINIPPEAPRPPET